MEKSYISKNGIPIYTYKNPHQHGFFISLFLRAGSMYEEAGECGITHFLEHAIIRNVNRVMDEGLYPLLDKYGIEFNASTFSEMVQIYVSGATKNFKHGANIISKTLLPLALTGEDLKAERDRIKAEIRESDEASSLASFASKIVNEGTSLSRPILGTLGGVSKITLRRLEEYRRRVFTPENMFFYVTGNFADSDIESLSLLVSGASINRGDERRNEAPVSEKFGKRGGQIHIKNGEGMIVRFNFDLDVSALGMPVTDLLYDALLTGYNSDFFIEMSEKRGLFYDLSGSVERYKNIGTLSFSYEVRSDALYEAVDLTLDILKRMREELMREDGCMKAGYVDNAMMLYDDARELNFTMAYDNHIMNNAYASLKERAERYRAVTARDIRDAARRIFTRDNLTLTVKGNKKKIDKEKLATLVGKL
ncbi:MAG: insulinase family protein [Clostridia bacterium]|nr:insulinase family protein [Clostridia bacterium]